MTKRVKSYMVLTLIYGLTWFPLLATQRAFFWDDWVLHNDNKAITNYFIQAGTPWIVNLHIGLGYDPTLYRIITFVAFLIVTLGFMYILEKSVTLTGFSTATNLVTAIAAVVIPITPVSPDAIDRPTATESTIRVSPDAIDRPPVISPDMFGSPDAAEHSLSG
mgnify:CR=1 FL=1